MKRIINAIVSGWKVYRKPQMFQPSMINILEGQIKFLEETAKENRPMVTHIANIYWEDGKKEEVKILTLWCGIGDDTPIDRCKELAAENSKLKLEIAKLLEK